MKAIIHSAVVIVPVFCILLGIVIHIIRNKREKKEKEAERAQQERISKAVSAGQAEVFQKTLVRSLEELAGMPGDLEIGPDNLPRPCGSADWGRFMVYKTHSGSVYHRTPNCSSLYGSSSLHIWTAYQQGFYPCSRCNPPRPDLRWYRDYLGLYELSRQYHSLLIPYPGPSADYLRAEAAEDEIHSLRRRLSVAEEKLRQYESLNIEEEIKAGTNKQVEQKTREVLHSRLFQSTLVSYDFHSRLPIDTNARLLRAQQEEAEIIPPLQITAHIQGKSSVYTTTMNDCTCPDFQRNKEPCKHMYRLALEMGLLLSIPTDDVKTAMKRLSAAHARNQKELERMNKRKK